VQCTGEDCARHCFFVGATACSWTLSSFGPKCGLEIAFDIRYQEALSIPQGMHNGGATFSGLRLRHIGIRRRGLFPRTCDASQNLSLNINYGQTVHDKRS
jgi:hypothetical protein